MHFLYERKQSTLLSICFKITAPLPCLTVFHEAEKCWNADVLIILTYLQSWTTLILSCDSALTTLITFGCIVINLKVLPKITNVSNRGQANITFEDHRHVSHAMCLNAPYFGALQLSLVPTQLSAYINLLPGQHPSCEAIVLYTENHCKWIVGTTADCFWPGQSALDFPRSLCRLRHLLCDIWQPS